MQTPPPWVVHLRFGNLRRNEFHALLARVWPQIERLLKSHKLVNVYSDRLEGIGWQSLPVLNRLHRAMELIRRKTLPQGLLGQAIDYTLKRWEALTRFIEDETLEIDNNLIENAIRPSALGKRNWLFVGHPEAGEHSAVIYTLLGSCRRYGINPFDYLKDLFTRLPAAKITQIREFTPAAWAKAKEKMLAQAA